VGKREEEEDISFPKISWLDPPLGVLSIERPTLWDHYKRSWQQISCVKAHMQDQHNFFKKESGSIA